MHFPSFHTHNSEACLCPFGLQESKGPKAVIFMKDLNAMFQPEKIAHPHGLQITFHNDGPTRNLYVYHESGEVAPSLLIPIYMSDTFRAPHLLFFFYLQEIVSWYNAIRAARYAYLKTAYPIGSDEEVGVSV